MVGFDEILQQVKHVVNQEIEALKEREEKSVEIMARWRDDNNLLSQKIASLEVKLAKDLFHEGSGSKSQPGNDNGKLNWLDLGSSQDIYFQSCQKFATSKKSDKEREQLFKHIEMTTLGKEFIGDEFRRLFKDFYQPKDGLAPAEVKVYEEDVHLVIGKVLKEFAAMQTRNNPQPKKLPHLENGNPLQLTPGFGPGHAMVTNELKNHIE
ncbi:hypothetical protein DSO57_1004858 [Entomophthora muscae]|uniref:Uncharacterized protein n=1 Tax=Entomophthora muscae TaxID=34485 RepID=A0ACC2RZB2_9FUNG|nr:hypothetical protein DSO57_1004858 [Entomophthora muscae]